MSTQETITLPIDLARLVLHPCHRYDCDNGKPAYRTVPCYVDQCCNDSHTERVPCESAWHKLDEDTQKLLLTD